MDSQDPSIEEKLVPFVEGALAEPDRREVLQALPSQPALNQEIRHLREAIMALRGQAARGLGYQSPVEAPPEQVVDFALNGDQWSRQSSRQFQLHLLESSSLAQELDILRELEQDLQQRVEPSKAVPEMPAALRQAIQETYGKPPADPAWKRAAAAIVAWTAGLNLKVASAAVAGCVLVVGGLSLARFNHNQIQSGQKTVAASTPAPVAATSTPEAVAVAPQGPPAGQVALLKEKVLPEDLPGLSRRLYYKGVTHSYQDGQIYVAQADFDKAWSALQMNNEKASSVKGLKTGGVPQPQPVAETNLLDGVIGQLPKRDHQPSKPPQSQVAAADDGAKAQTGGLVGPSPDPKGAVAVVDLPAEPEASRGGGYTAPAPASAPAPAAYLPASRPQHQSVEQPVVPAQGSYNRSSVPVGRRDPVAPVSRPAAPVTQVTARPSQAAHYAPQPAGGKDRSRADQVQAQAQPARPDSKLGQVFHAKARKESARPADVLASNTASPGSEAPAIEALQKPANPEPVAETKVKPAPIQAAAPPPPPPAPVTAASNANMDVETEEENLPPPSQVALEQKKAERPQGKPEADDGRMTGGVARNRSEEVRSQFKQAANENVGASRASMSAAGSRAGNVRDESFQVQAGAPFEVAMLPVAKKLIEDLVGEAKVQMERKEDGHLLVTIRPARSLSAQEVDKLRKVVREKLELKEEDTVVIRQP
ncbi:hypothetical protein JST97_10765 [bacterium]|nr:hypothetical protein [bacterium]